MSGWKYLFGPVPSRRFGLSLGVDILRMKSCTLNCTFCQIGRTDKYELQRAEYANIDSVIAELAAWRKSGATADYITLSGSGEPTLHTGFGEVLTYIKENMDIPGLLLSNGTLMHIPEVREAATQAAIIKTSLCAWDQVSYELVNRPGQGMTFSDLVDGERKLRTIYDGQLWLEVFLVQGVNDADDQVERIAEIAASISPDRIHLNTVERPPAESEAQAVPPERMAELRDMFEPRGEIIGDFTVSHASGLETSSGSLLAIIRRRPCSADQLAESSGADPNAVSDALSALIASGELCEEQRDGKVYYRVQKG